MNGRAVLPQPYIPYLQGRVTRRRRPQKLSMNRNCVGLIVGG